MLFVQTTVKVICTAHVAATWKDFPLFKCYYDTWKGHSQFITRGECDNEKKSTFILWNDSTMH